jgi:hypothetical protein
MMAALSGLKSKAEPKVGRAPEWDSGGIVHERDERPSSQPRTAFFA